MAKMKKSMGGVSNDDLDTISKRIKLKGNILAAVSKPKPIFNSGKKRTDYSVFRTPSGTDNLSKNLRQGYQHNEIKINIIPSLHQGNKN